MNDPTRVPGDCPEAITPSGLPIRKYLDVSTIHITREDDELLSSDCTGLSPAVIAYRKDGYSYWVYVAHDDEDEEERKLRKAGYSQAFIVLLQEARAVGAGWICIDRDGAYSDKLPSFDW